MTPSHPTSPAVPAAASAEEALRFAQSLARSRARALGETVAGVILHGSLTRADYLPGRSDVDLLVVVDGPLTDAQLADWEAIGDDAELTVLTTCRVWRFAEEGRHCSKTAAAEWALGRDPTLRVVRDALHRRRGDPTRSIVPAQVAQLLAVVRGRLAEARDGS